MPRKTPFFSSLRFQVIALMLLCYLIPSLLLGLFTQLVLLPSARQKTDTALRTSVEHAWTLAVRNVNHVIDLGRDAIYDGDLLAAYDRWTAGEITDAEYLRDSRAYMERKYSREAYCTFAAFFPISRPDLYIYNRTSYEEALSFLENGQEEALSLGSTLDTEDLFVQRNGRICLIRNMVDLQMKRYGMLVLGISRETLFAPLLELADSWNGRLLLRLDGAGDEADWAAYPDAQSTEGDNLRYVLRSDNDDFSLEMLLILNKREYYREFYQFRTFALLIYLLLIPILLLLGWYIRRRIIRPITLLASASRRIENGELGITVPMRGNDELADLGRAFSSMSQRIEDLIDRTYKEELALKNAQIGALQSRINPHFINNALEAINWESRIEGSETVPAMVDKLSVLLNASMSRQNRRIVPLREEIEVAEAYIYFVQQRYGDSLTIHREEDERALDCPVPLLTLQPALENAVEHGIAPAGGGEIFLFCHPLPDSGETRRVRIEIINTGKPLNEEDRQKIAVALRGDTDSGNHLGVANIAERLRLIYGGRSDIQIFSDEENRTVVRMDIPCDPA